MKAQRNERDVPASLKERQIKVLLVGRDEEFKGNVAHRVFNRAQLWIAGRSASLLGALERLRSEAIDIVLLSHKFRNEELALFIADARRNGFEGLILRVTPMQASAASSASTSFSAGLSRKAPVENPLLSMQNISGVSRLDDRWNTAISFTVRQQEVLARVPEGWSNLQIARDLNCSEGGVKATLQELFKKLGVRKRSQLVRVVLERGLVDAKRKVGIRGAGDLSRPVSPAVNLGNQEPIHVGDFVIDLAMHRVWVRGVETHLTPSEFELLVVFATHPGELLRGSSLREMFWRNPTSKQDTLRVLVAALRAKIEVTKTPRYVVTERHLGYRFSPSPSRDGEGTAPRPTGRVR
jgi:DNA-binding NarL/FixJ family response regulator/DNA-binding winged helix-turn-helix (wHTH) protein